MPPLESARLTQKQETFCLKYFELGNAREAAQIAKYSPRSADVIGRENLLKPTIQARIDQLRQAAEDASVASVLERKQILTEITRGKLSQFVDDCGVIDRTKLDSSAIQAVDQQTILGKMGTIIKLRLHNPIKAIEELNKMEKVYEANVINNNTVVFNILVADKKTKDLIERVGERTGKLIE